MAIKIVISRTVTIIQEPSVKPIFSELHLLAWKSNGYISGETLVNVSNPDNSIIISSWQTIEDWERFQAMEEVRQLHAKVEQILGTKTVQTIYKNK